MKRYTIRDIPDQQYTALQELAARRRWSINKLLLDLIEQYVVNEMATVHTSFQDALRLQDLARAASILKPFCQENTDKLARWLSRQDTTYLTASDSMTITAAYDTWQREQENM